MLNISQLLVVLWFPQNQRCSTIPSWNTFVDPMFITRSLILTFVQLDSNSLQPPKPPLFFCELKKVVNQFFGDFFVFLGFILQWTQGTHETQKKSTPNCFYSKAICDTLRVTWKSEAMAAEADAEDFCWGICVCVCVSDVVVGHVP